MIRIKRLIYVGMVVFLVVILAGCGTKGNVSNSNQTMNPSVAQSSNQQGTSKLPSSNSSTAQKQAQAPIINSRSAQGQAEIDQKIDQQLNSLDKTLDSLDNSLGNL
ncbi:hypothetical protein [Desulfosporosinus sp. OT]|uniref:hypothetical protein n=1 Tax=Desulfosporosinus sp. OT TaxID=913865 RepID=UPI00058CFEF6|nr:hypothetical protein [Desulfosporosinus sp. OT]